MGWMLAVLRAGSTVETPTSSQMKRVVLVALQVFAIFISFTPVFIAGQAGTEHLTYCIDCGSDRNYTDNGTGISWVTDEPFIQTGKNAQNVIVYPSNEAYVNKGQLSTLRYFDDSRTRHCYVLPVTARTTYLLRAVFFLGSLTDSIKGDISFSIYFNATNWWSLWFGAESDFNQTRSYEAIIYSPGDVLDICLLPDDRNKAAFISTLELRELTSGMYSDGAAGGYQYQDIIFRINAGATPAGVGAPLSYLRYPDDPYDRLWWAPGSWSGAPRINNSRKLSSNVQIQNRLPDVVMNDAWTQNDTDAVYFFNNSTSDYPIGPIITYCYVMEFGENGRAANLTSIQYSVNDIHIDTFNASSVPQQIVSSITVPVNYYNMSFTPTKGSTSPAVLNAFEVYGLYDVQNSYTAIADGACINHRFCLLELVSWFLG